MDCRSCGVVNDAGRRYCRECGARLGGPCAACQFFNAFDDKHCGGCGRRLTGGALADAGLAGVASQAPALAPVAASASADAAGIGAAGVSQTEIDGLFENILDDDEQAGGEA